MNWEAIGAVGDLLGGMAVVATLVYLAVQLKHSKTLLERNEKISLSQVYQSRTDTRVGLQLALASADYSEAVKKLWGRPDLVDDLSDHDRLTARSYMTATMVVQDNVLYQGSLGLLDEDMLAAATSVIVTNFEVWEKLEIIVTPRVRACHERQKDTCRTVGMLAEPGSPMAGFG